MNARYYDPAVGSFISSDPAMEGINHYAYAGCNPIKYTDPTGLVFMGPDPGGQMFTSDSMAQAARAADAASRAAVSGAINSNMGFLRASGTDPDSPGAKTFGEAVAATKNEQAKEAAAIAALKSLLENKLAAKLKAQKENNKIETDKDYPDQKITAIDELLDPIIEDMLSRLKENNPLLNIDIMLNMFNPFGKKTGKFGEFDFKYNKGNNPNFSKIFKEGRDALYSYRGIIVHDEDPGNMLFGMACQYAGFGRGFASAIGNTGIFYEAQETERDAYFYNFGEGLLKTAFSKF